MNWFEAFVWPGILGMLGAGAYIVGQSLMARKRRRLQREKWDRELWQKYLDTLTPEEREVQEPYLRREGFIE